MTQEKTKLKKHLGIEQIKKVFPICSALTCETLLSPHIHFKGAIMYVRDNERHQLEMSIPASLIL